jgi:hypothetical protein
MENIGFLLLKKNTFCFSELAFEKLIDKKEKYNPIYCKKNLPISQINNNNNNLLSKQTTTSKRSSNSRGLPTNTKYTPKENLKKDYKHFKNKYDNNFSKK